MSFKIYLIGFSAGHLAPGAERALSVCRRILVSESLLEALERQEIFPRLRDRLRAYRRFAEALEALEEARRRQEEVAFIASGDPLFFGAGRTFLERFGPGFLEIFPTVSFPQLAFSRLKLPWEDFFFVSLHGGAGLPRRFALEDLPGLLRRHGKLCVFTDAAHGPREIAAHLAPRVPERDLRFLVAERLGLAGERLWEGPPSEALSREFAFPNLVLLLYEGPGRLQGFGLSSREIAHPRGLLTKDEVRAVVIHKLALPERGIFWDVGAGAGGVSTEVARTFPLLRVFSVERSPERAAYLEENRQRFGLLNLEIIRGEAPEVLGDLPDPDRVFVGGSGGRLPEILEHLCRREFSGPLVLTLVSLEHLEEARRFLSKRGFDLEVIQMTVFPARNLAGHTVFSSRNPVFVLKALRG